MSKTMPRTLSQILWKAITIISVASMCSFYILWFREVLESINWIWTALLIPGITAHILTMFAATVKYAALRLMEEELEFLQKEPLVLTAETRSEPGMMYMVVMRHSKNKWVLLPCETRDTDTGGIPTKEPEGLGESGQPRNTGKSKETTKRVKEILYFEKGKFSVMPLDNLTMYVRNYGAVLPVEKQNKSKGCED